MSLHCPICNSISLIPHYPGLVKCQICDFIWADIYSNEINFQELYGHSYFFGDEYQDYISEENILKFGFSKFNRKFVDLFKKSTMKPKLLELGSAYGFFLDIAKNDFICEGIEINAEAREYCINKGLNIVGSDLMSLNRSKTYDIVVSFASLEHIPDPKQVLEKIHEILKPGGYCYITTINIDSLLAKISGNKWRMIHPPTHINYFSSKTLRLLLETTGFSIKRCGSVWQYRSLDALLLPKLNKTFIYKIIHGLGLTKIPIPFNFGDIIGVLSERV